ncbi:hypothetical protein J4207_00555 [Candidatus Woesearchaeota archaeon]|nr:hypothetical protein [Candidatus Woesearchaeota archaeon]
MEKIILSFLLIFIIIGCQQTSELEQQNIEVPSEQKLPQQEIAPPTVENHETKPSQQRRQSPIFTSLEGCEEKEVTFTHLPLPIDKINVIEPQGELTGYVSGHITPGDHVGFQYDSKSPAIPVYALADGYLVRVERNPGYFGIGVKNYHLYIEYSCTLFGSYVHVTEIAQELLDANKDFKELDSFEDDSIPDNKRYPSVRIPVKAGQMIGKTEKWGLLGMLTADTKVTLTGFTTPKIYEGEPWKTHAVPVFNYFTPELKKQLEQKNPRTQAPVYGKIDFDVPSKLVGNWFLENTDYSGQQKAQYCGDYICPYWDSHLAFVYDFVDPTQARVSIGFKALEDQGPYGILGNTDPKTIGADGVTKLELVKLNDITSKRGFQSEGKQLITENSDEVLGTMLVQMTDDNHLTMEVFQGKKASQVSGFSGKEKKYYR